MAKRRRLHCRADYLGRDNLVGLEMTDTPIGHRADGSPIYDNTPTVVAVLVRMNPGILMIRRGHNPGKGLFGLPGGYHMRGETWQQAGAREVLEETGYRIIPSMMTLASMETDEYGNNLAIADYIGPVEKTDLAIDGEAEEVLIITKAPPASHVDWAFPRHFDAVRRAICYEL